MNQELQLAPEEKEMLAIIGIYNRRNQRIDMRELANPTDEAKAFKGLSVQEISSVLKSLESKGLISGVSGNMGYTLIESMAADSET